jgi:adenosylhomocysteine nucleosidase
LLVSGDRDLLVDEIPLLKERYGAVAGDWESGAIAWVAKNNRARLLILRGVSDIVGPNGSQAYGNLSYFEKASQNILKRLVESLPGWINLQKNA